MKRQTKRLIRLFLVCSFPLAVLTSCFHEDDTEILEDARIENATDEQDANTNKPKG